MKLFGKELFKKQEDKPMHDFIMHGLSNRDYGFGDLVQMVAEPGEQKPKKEKKEPERLLITPKGLMELGSLNENDFKIVTDEKYIKDAIEDIDQKLGLLPEPKKVKGNNLFGSSEAGSSFWGREELKSIKERLQNRAKIDLAKKILEEYPHTTTAKIFEVTDKNSHLRCRKADEFIPDFPKEAIKAMKDYNEMCEAVGGKKTNFYVIADKKDFGEVSKRRDPILLAQSPFGFFWQILGAWDEEMIYLGDL